MRTTATTKSASSRNPGQVPPAVLHIPDDDDAARGTGWARRGTAGVVGAAGCGGRGTGAAGRWRRLRVSLFC